MSHFVLLTLAYPPDSSAVGQIFEDTALRLAKRGHRVTVYTGSTSIERSEIKAPLPPQPMVRVIRLKWTGSSERRLLPRLVGQGLYFAQVFLRLLFQRGVDGLILTTIPPTTGFMYLKLRIFREIPTLYWVMDVNPDRGVATGGARESSLPVKLLHWANTQLFRGSQVVVVMDRYMRQRVLRKNYLQDHECGKVEIIPPWHLAEHLRLIPKGENTFITAYGLENKCVFLYSGNHSPEHPLGTLLSSIRAKRRRTDLAFLFIGGGRGKEAVEAFICQESPGNVRSLPYQPQETMSFSLSAADVHVVVMGDAMVGIVHPCKIYTAMALGKPVLFIGPRGSPFGELVDLCGFGWTVEHGDVDTLDALIEEIAAMPRTKLQEIGAKGRELIEGSYSADRLAGRFCDLVEQLGGPPIE